MLDVRKDNKVALNNSKTRAAKAKAQMEYIATNKEVKKSIRKVKRDHIDNLAKQAEEAEEQKNLRKLYGHQGALQQVSTDTQAIERQKWEPSHDN